MTTFEYFPSQDSVEDRLGSVRYVVKSLVYTPYLKVTRRALLSSMSSLTQRPENRIVCVSVCVCMRARGSLQKARHDGEGA